mgnify:CR=1 FL=1
MNLAEVYLFIDKPNLSQKLLRNISKRNKRPNNILHEKQNKRVTLSEHSFDVQ